MRPAFFLLIAFLRLEAQSPPLCLEVCTGGCTVWSLVSFPGLRAESWEPICDPPLPQCGAAGTLLASVNVSCLD